MRLLGKFGVLLLAFVVVLGVRGRLVPEPRDEDLARLAVRQLDGGADAADELSAAERTRRWSAGPWPVLALLLGLTAVVFGRDLSRLRRVFEMKERSS
jgi:hypothetical protein